MIADLIAEDDGQTPGRVDFLRALEAGGIQDAKLKAMYTWTGEGTDPEPHRMPLLLRIMRYFGYA